MKYKKHVSVIVPAYNAENCIEYCLKSLLNLNYPSYEIIIVDNNSTDRTKEIIKKYPVNYLFENKRGSYSARNKGVKHATGEIICFTDSDCIVDKNWLTEIIKPFKYNKVGGVGGKIIPLFNDSNVIEKYSAKLVSNKLMNKTHWICTANAAYRKDLIKFDEKFKSWGDYDLSYRLYRNHIKLSYKKEAIVYHASRKTLKGLVKQIFRYGFYHLMYIKKNHDLRINIDINSYLK